MASEHDAYHELCGYTLTHGDAAFVHQHVVDAYAAQRADDATRPIGLTFALVGLYLHLEKGFSGRQVQRAHMQLARRRRAWPAFTLPSDRGTMTARDVLAVPGGPARDRAIDEWCRSVWAAFSIHRQAIDDLLREHALL
jgi:Family of unknown function (DUF5946)